MNEYNFQDFFVDTQLRHLRELIKRCWIRSLYYTYTYIVSVRYIDLGIMRIPCRIVELECPEVVDSLTYSNYSIAFLIINESLWWILAPVQLYTDDRRKADNWEKPHLMFCFHWSLIRVPSCPCMPRRVASIDRNMIQLIFWTWVKTSIGGLCSFGFEWCWKYVTRSFSFKYIKGACRKTRSPHPELWEKITINNKFAHSVLYCSAKLTFCALSLHELL